MPIRLPEVPAAGVETIRSELQELLAEPELLQGTFGAASVERLVLSAPHRVFTVGLEDLVQRGLDAATPTSVRHLILDGGQPVASVEVNLDGSFNHVNEGPFVAATASAVLAAEALAQVQAGSFELRLLRVSALHTMAVWLKDESGGNDVLLPMSPGPVRLEPGRPLDLAQFQAVVQELAREHLAADPAAAG